jgi:hypothetical protein
MNVVVNCHITKFATRKVVPTGMLYKVEQRYPNPLLYKTNKMEDYTFVNLFELSFPSHINA